MLYSFEYHELIFSQVQLILNLKCSSLATGNPCKSSPLNFSPWHFFSIDLKTSLLLLLNKQYIQTCPDFFFNSMTWNQLPSEEFLFFWLRIILQTHTQVSRCTQEVVFMSTVATLGHSKCLSWKVNFFKVTVLYIWILYLTFLRGCGFIDHQDYLLHRCQGVGSVTCYGLLNRIMPNTGW